MHAPPLPTQPHIDGPGCVIIGGNADAITDSGFGVQDAFTTVIFRPCVAGVDPFRAARQNFLEGDRALPGAVNADIEGAVIGAGGCPVIIDTQPGLAVCRVNAGCPFIGPVDFRTDAVGVGVGDDREGNGDDEHDQDKN